MNIHSLGLNLMIPITLTGAWHVANRDEAVPAHLWRYNTPTLLPWRDPKSGSLHKVASFGKGMGYSDNPNAAYSHWGLYNTQTKHNCRGRRTSIDWKPGEPITKTHLTTPILRL